MQPYLALITPLGGGHPDQGLPGQPPGIWPSPGHPAHPIAPGGPPPGFWGGVAPPYPDQGLPGWQPRPSHPIAPGGQPPGIWGGPPAYPDQGLPPGAPPGIWPSPGVPTHPWVPPAGESIPPPPEEIVNQYVVAVWSPTAQSWTVSVSDTAPAPQA